MGTNPHYFAILVVDIESFGRRRNPVQELLRTRLYAIVEDSLVDSGLGNVDAVPCSDRGDGAFWLLPPSISKVNLSGSFINALNARLAEHARVCQPEAAMRLRVALHAGEVSHDQHGWVGADLNTACRLVDLPDLRSALASAPASGLALAISDSWYQAIVRHDYPGTGRDSFRDVPFVAKEIRQRAWIRVPGYNDPPGVSRSDDSGPRSQAQRSAAETGLHASAQRPDLDASSPEPLPGARETPISSAKIGPFAGASINAERVYGGDHYEGQGGQPGHD
jgi:hypothetical protein